jgi:hypothetical protein
MSVIDRIVDQNNALWTLLTKGDDMTRDQRIELINRAFPKSPITRSKLKFDQRDTATALLDDAEQPSDWPDEIMGVRRGREGF